MERTKTEIREAKIAKIQECFRDLFMAMTDYCLEVHCHVWDPQHCVVCDMWRDANIMKRQWEMKEISRDKLVG